MRSGLFGSGVPQGAPDEAREQRHLDPIGLVLAPWLERIKDHELQDALVQAALAGRNAYEEGGRVERGDNLFDAARAQGSRRLAVAAMDADRTYMVAYHRATCLVCAARAGGPLRLSLVTLPPEAVAALPTSPWRAVRSQPGSLSAVARRADEGLVEVAKKLVVKLVARGATAASRPARTPRGRHRPVR